MNITRGHTTPSRKGRDAGVLEILILAGLLVVAFASWRMWTMGGVFSVQATHAELARQAIPSPVRASSAPLTSADAPPASVEHRTNYFSELGQTGDAFGGLNALMTTVAGALLAWAGYLQFRTLQRAKADAREAAQHRDFEQYQTLVFQILELANRVVDQAEGPDRKGKLTALVPGGKNQYEKAPPRTGFRGLDAYARKIFDAVPPSKLGPETAQEALLCLMTSFLKAQESKPSMFGRYFRVQRELFAHIADPTVNTAIQDKLAGISRSQISDGAVLLIALYGLTEEGHGMAPLIERFGLLRHMHRRYRAQLSPALLIGYRKESFLNGGAQLNPLLPADYFKALENEIRGEADDEDDLATVLHAADGEENPDAPL